MSLYCHNCIIPLYLIKFSIHFICAVHQNWSSPKHVEKIWNKFLGVTKLIFAVIEVLIKSLWIQIHTVNNYQNYQFCFRIRLHAINYFDWECFFFSELNKRGIKQLISKKICMYNYAYLSYLYMLHICIQIIVFSLHVISTRCTMHFLLDVQHLIQIVFDHILYSFKKNIWREILYKDELKLDIDLYVFI